ncbi:MAG: hypothetical protein KF777_13595 [Planctomycetaceae bacterium]|nr:hypothetical protein [Planctomycetaceae bacterium]
MITRPNRLLEAVQAIEAGQPVDWDRLAKLQTLDLVIVGRQFIEQAVIEQEQADERIRELLEDITPPPA